MRQNLNHFRELILTGKKKGRLILPLSNWSQLQVTFDRDPVTGRFILQAFENATWLFTLHEFNLNRVAQEFDNLINEYLCWD